MCILQIKLAQFIDHMKKAKKIIDSWNWTFHKCQYYNLLNIKIASVCMSEISCATLTEIAENSSK